MTIKASFRALTFRNPRLIDYTRAKPLAAQLHQDHAREVIRKLSNYPPYTPVKYIRTGELFRSWSINGPSSFGGGLQTQITNNATDPKGIQYAIRVYGDNNGNNQWDMHANHGWPTLLSALDREGYHKKLQSFYDSLVEVQ